MPVVIDYDYSDVAHLQGFFDELSVVDQRKIFMDAFKRATTGLVEEVKGSVPQGKTKNLLRSVGQLPIPQDVALLVGTRKGGGYKGWHGHLLENGTEERFRKTKTGKSVPTGRIIGIHFFEEAYTGKEESIADEVQKQFYIAIDNAIVRINKKLNKAR
jgi:hypothetical protein